MFFGNINLVCVNAMAGRSSKRHLGVRNPQGRKSKESKSVKAKEYTEDSEAREKDTSVHVGNVQGYPGRVQENLFQQLTEMMKESVLPHKKKYVLIKVDVNLRH